MLADWVRRGTEQLAAHAGPAIGGLLNVSFGSLAELILTLFVLAGGQVAVVQAQITGSILATTLLGLGLAMLVGGIGRNRQCLGRIPAGKLLPSLVVEKLSFAEESSVSDGPIPLRICFNCRNSCRARR